MKLTLRQAEERAFAIFTLEIPYSELAGTRLALGELQALLDSEGVSKALLTLARIVQRIEETGGD